MIALRFVSGVAFENDSNKIFHITTPLRKIVLEGKHEVPFLFHFVSIDFLFVFISNFY